MVAPEESDINTTLIIWNKPLDFDEKYYYRSGSCTGRRDLQITHKQSTISSLESKAVKA